MEGDKKQMRTEENGDLKWREFQVVVMTWCQSSLSMRALLLFYFLFLIGVWQTKAQAIAKRILFLVVPSNDL